MKVKMLIETNNQLREQLTKENQSYYDKLLVYTRLKGGMIYSEQQSEEILLVILEDILEAQNEGISAETYFGKEPQKVADSMLRELKPEPWQTKVKFGGYLIGIYALFTLFPSLVSPRQGIDLGKFLLSFSVVVVMVSLLFKLVKASIYQDIKWEKTKFLCFYLLAYR